jgi:hypothetical protein
MVHREKPHVVPPSGLWVTHWGAGVCAAILLLGAAARAQDQYDYGDLHETGRVVEPARHRDSYHYSYYGEAPPLALLPTEGWKLKIDHRNDIPLTAAEQKVFESKIEALGAILGRTPVFNPPIGIWVSAEADYVLYSYSPRDGQDWAKLPAMMRMQIRIHGIVGTWDQLPTKNCYDCEAIATIEINALSHLVSFGAGYRGGDVHDRLPDGRSIALVLPQKGEVAGFPAYTTSTGDLLFVLSKPGRTPWVPITAEQYVQAVIRSREESIEKSVAYSNDRSRWSAKQASEIEDQKKSDEWLAVLRAELDGMTPDQRASEAWYNPDHKPYRSGAVPPDTPGARQLVVINPDYFDHSLPRTALQLITVLVEHMGSHPEDAWQAYPRRAAEFANTADWKGVLQLCE